ncbi:MAG: MotA/TolQ/ExbB proton channel family protein [Epsilonproteobacteria bacterium]|nr:MotA/TolQ/ExbB proton channel family protein [Campylobacterota bacterium]
MGQLELILSYLDRSSTITILVLILLSIYFILVNWIFFYRYLSLGFWLKKERFSLETIQMGNKKPAINSFLATHCQSEKITKKEYGEYCTFQATTQSTKGLTFLSIAASTSPFIGLFGTVVSILETFAIMGSSKTSLATISSSIGEALVATAAGIFVAIFAYTYHLLLKRKAFELISYLKMQLDLLVER